MEQQFLSVDSLLDPQLHNNIQQGRMINNSVGNNNGGMVSDNNNDSGENSVRVNANMAVGHAGPSGGDGSNHRVGGHGDSNSGGDGRRGEERGVRVVEPVEPSYCDGTGDVESRCKLSRAVPAKRHAGWPNTKQ